MLRIWVLLWTQQVKIPCPVELVFKWAKTENKQNTQLRETYAVLRVGNFYQKMKKCELRQMATGFPNGIIFFLRGGQEM